MKFSNILPFVFASAALAITPTSNEGPSLVERDLATISSAVSVIQSRVVSLGSAVDSYSSAANRDALQSASDATVSSINDANTAIAPTSAITLNEALTLSNQIDGLTSQINTAIDKAINKKSLFVSSGAGPAVLAGLQAQRSAADKLIPTVVSKVPSGAQGIANQKAQGITNALQRGIDAFADQASATRRHARGLIGANL